MLGRALLYRAYRRSGASNWAASVRAREPVYAQAFAGDARLERGFSSRIEALEAERIVGGWSRAKKEAMIAGNWSSVRSEEHTSELQSLMRISYAVFCLKNKTTNIWQH